MNNNNKTIEIGFFIFIFSILIYLLYHLFTPLFGALIFGAILAGSFLPFHKRMKKKLKFTDHTCALIVCTLITFGFVIPAVYISIQISSEVIEFYGKVKIFIESGQVEQLLLKDNFLINLLKRVLQLFEIQPNISEINNKLLQIGQNFSGTFLKTLNNFLSNILSFLFDFSITMLTTYAFLAQGTGLKKYVFTLSPLPDEQEELLLERFNQMNYVSLVCNGIGAIIQGLLGGLAFILVGIGSPFLWTALMIILAFIPLVGISVISVPASLYLILIEGSTVAGVFLFVFCALVAFITENLFKPKFIGDRIKINSLFVLFTIISGMIVFSLPGVFYGPIIGILFLTAASIFQEHYISDK